MGWQHSIAGGQGNLVPGSFQNPDFEAGVQGWQVTRAGHAEFNDITIRGGIIEGGNALYYSGTPAHGNLVASITGGGGTDDFGNQFLEGSSAYFNVGGSPQYAVQMAEGQVTFYAWNGSTWVPGASVNGQGPTPSSFLKILADDFRIRAKTILFNGPGSASGTIVVYPSGDTTGVTDATNINVALVSATDNAVQLLPGDYYINIPIAMQQGNALTGTGHSLAIPSGAGATPLAGTIIHGVAAFTGTAMIQLPSTNATQLGNCLLSDLTLSGQGLPAGVHGIQADFSGGNTLRYVTVWSVPGDGLHAAPAAATGFQIPDFWMIDHCKFSACGGNGVSCAGMADTYVSFCEATGNGADGWLWNNGGNLHAVGCKGENNGNGRGWHLTSSAGYNGERRFTGCTSQLNGEDGWLFASSSANSSDFLVSCKSTDDGQAAGTWAGFHATGNKGLVSLTGCQAAGNDYGAEQDTASFEMWATGCTLSGTTAATHDDGTNTLALVNQAPAPGDPWHVIGAASQPAFGAGFAAPGGGDQTARFTLDADGVTVVLDGVAQTTGATAANATMFTLPAAYRPPLRKRFAGVTSASGYATAGQSLVQVTTAGAVTCVPACSGAGQVIVLDGMRFPIT